MKNAYLWKCQDILSASFHDPSTGFCFYNQWTVFPSDFDPVAAGLTLVMSPVGDLDADDAWDADDVDILANKIGGRPIRPDWLPDAAFDMKGDGVIDMEDHRIWVKDLAHTWFGDANLDGEFNTSDFVHVFQVGKYETQQYAGWAEGDWDGDGVFDTGDLVIAFHDGGYEKGPKTGCGGGAGAGAWVLLMVGLSLSMVVCRSRCAELNNHPIRNIVCPDRGSRPAACDPRLLTG